jgi:hypothetical protein
MLVSPEEQKANLAPTLCRENNRELSFPPKSVFNQYVSVTSGLPMIVNKESSSSEECYSDDEFESAVGESAVERLFGAKRKDDEENDFYGIDLSM